MNLKKGALLLGVSLSTAVLAACGKSTPNLNFEETLAAYNKSNAAIMQMMNMVSNPDATLESNFNGTVSINADQKGSGKLLIDSKNIVENKTHNAEWEVNLTLDANSTEQSGPFKWNLNAKFGLKSLIKDLQIYLQLSNLEVKSDNQEIEQQLGFALAMINGFKNKWFTLDIPEVEELIKMNQVNFDIPTSMEIWTKAEYYLNPTSTTYEGQPAWKVDFNQEVIKAEVKKVIREIYGDLNPGILSGEELQHFLTEKEEMLKGIESTIDEMKFENVDAYFVIYPEDVKFVLKNADIFVKELKINVSQSVTEEKDMGIFMMTPLTGELDKKVELVYEVKNEGKRKYSFTIEFKVPETSDVKLQWKFAYELEDKNFVLKPDVKMTLEGLVIQFQGNYNVKNLEKYVFNAPENAESIQNLLGGMFGWIGQNNDTMLDDQENSGSISTQSTLE